MLSSSSLLASSSSSRSSSSSSSTSSRGFATQPAASSTAATGPQQAQQPSSDEEEFVGPFSPLRPLLWKHITRNSYSIRPSVLSPLHALHRDHEETERRIQFLQTAMTAQLKLSEEIQPDEVAAHAGSASPVAAAIAARRQQLAAVKEAHDKLVDNHIYPYPAARHATAYYTALEMSLIRKDKGSQDLQKVLEGDVSVWDYWFGKFSRQYEGLPSLGSMEKIFNQADEDVILREMSRKRAAAGPKAAAEPKVDHLGRATAIGGRKTSRAQVFVWRGSGRVLVNRKPIDAYFPDLLLRSAALKPLSVTGLMGQVDVLVQVEGGGVSGQAQAAAHGIAKALRRLDPSLKPALRAAKLLKRAPPHGGAQEAWQGKGAQGLHLGQALSLACSLLL
ncbi:hypothetical protein OEZ86_007617 [Tetradesmus obliquus]|nr:hypothetical protein OEZ86_007617 [Tetradesmus obliquus]